MCNGIVIFLMLNFGFSQLTINLITIGQNLEEVHIKFKDWELIEEFSNKSFNSETYRYKKENIEWNLTFTKKTLYNEYIKGVTTLKSYKDKETYWVLSSMWKKNEMTNNLDYQLALDSINRQYKKYSIYPKVNNSILNGNNLFFVNTKITNYFHVDQSSISYFHNITYNETAGIILESIVENFSESSRD